MKRFARLRGFRPAPRAGSAAFTLTEILIATGLFTLVVVGVIYTHIFGLRLATLADSKLSATHNAREALNRVRDEVRSARTVYVGNGNGGGFTRLPVNTPQTGNALQLYPTADTNVFVRYYLDADEQSLMRKSSDDGDLREIAPYITNQTVFRAEDYLGNVLTNDQNNRVIRLDLEFYRWEFPIARVGAGYYYDYYHLQTRITRRAIE